MGYTASLGTCLSLLRKAVLKSEVVGEIRYVGCLLLFDRSCLIVGQHHLTDGFPSSDCVLRQPVRTVILVFLSTA